VTKRPKARPAKKRPAKATAVAVTKPERVRSTHPVDAELVRELAKILDDTGLSEIEIEHGELRLRLARTPMLQQPPAHTHVVHSAPAPVALPPPVAAPAPPPAAAPAPAADAASHPGAVLSPMVGTAYLSPEPGAPAFVKVGDTVTAGQTILVVEAMKTFNPIPAPRAGKVTAIIVTDAQPVEFNEPLLILE
jgi:acetyl-CoA carboxylase biotin carboxyl carrier protein